MAAILAFSTASAALPVAPDLAAAGWIERVLTGQLTTGLAVIAVAWFGLTMLTGRQSLRRGALLVLGCFVVFSAPGIAKALLGMAQGVSGNSTVILPASKIEAAEPPPDPPPSPPTYDPYAGASLPSGRR